MQDNYFNIACFNLRNVNLIVKPIQFFFLTLLILFTSASSANAQDIHFSQFFETPMFRNPALAGIFSGDMRLNLVYRNQWQNLIVPYQTGLFSSEFKLHIGKANDYITLGGEILY